MWIPNFTPYKARIDEFTEKSTIMAAQIHLVAEVRRLKEPNFGMKMERKGVMISQFPNLQHVPSINSRRWGLLFIWPPRWQMSQSISSKRQFSTESQSMQTLHRIEECSLILIQPLFLLLWSSQINGARAKSWFGETPMTQRIYSVVVVVVRERWVSDWPIVPACANEKCAWRGGKTEWRLDQILKQ